MVFYYLGEFLEEVWCFVGDCLFFCFSVSAYYVYCVWFVFDVEFLGAVVFSFYLCVVVGGVFWCC